MVTITVRITNNRAETLSYKRSIGTVGATDSTGTAVNVAPNETTTSITPGMVRTYNYGTYTTPVYVHDVAIGSSNGDPYYHCTPSSILVGNDAAESVTIDFEVPSNAKKGDIDYHDSGELEY